MDETKKASYLTSPLVKVIRMIIDNEVSDYMYSKISLSFYFLPGGNALSQSST